MFLICWLFFVPIESQTDQDFLRCPDENTTGTLAVFLCRKRLSKVSLILEPVLSKRQSSAIWAPNSCPWTVIVSAKAVRSEMACTLCQLSDLALCWSWPFPPADSIYDAVLTAWRQLLLLFFLIPVLASTPQHVRPLFLLLQATYLLPPSCFKMVQNSTRGFFSLLPITFSVCCKNRESQFPSSYIQRQKLSVTRQR